MPQRPAGATSVRAPQHAEEPAPTASGPARGCIPAATRVQVHGQSFTITPGFGPLPATYLPTAPRSRFRAGRGGTARLEALVFRVVWLLSGFPHIRASQDGCVEGTVRHLRSSS
jgi:hypothetical protein